MHGFDDPRAVVRDGSLTIDLDIASVQLARFGDDGSGELVAEHDHSLLAAQRVVRIERNAPNVWPAAPAERSGRW